jgi:hypothetical protein
MRAMIDEKRTYGRTIPDVPASPKAAARVSIIPSMVCYELGLHEARSSDAVVHGVEASNSDPAAFVVTPHQSGQMRGD